MFSMVTDQSYELGAGLEFEGGISKLCKSFFTELLAVATGAMICTAKYAGEGTELTELAGQLCSSSKL